MKTEIVYILDRSGSMGSNWEESMGSLKAFIKEQQKDETPCKFTLVGFDHDYDIFIDAKDLQEVDADNLPKFYPRGMTALYDSIGKTVMLVKERIKNTPVLERPNKVLFVITTDGFENASQEFNKHTIKDLVTKQETTDSWEFLYIGAGIDVMQDAQALGIKGANTLSTLNKSAKSFDTMSIYSCDTVAAYRSGTATEATLADIKNKAEQ